MNKLVIEFMNREQFEKEASMCKKIFDDVFQINDEEKVSIKVFVKDIPIEDDLNYLSKKKEKYILHLLKSGFSDKYIMKKMHIGSKDLERIKNKM